MKRAGPTVRAFKDRLRGEMETRGLHTRLWRGAHSESDHLVEIDSTPPTVIYVKERNADKGWWGLSESFLGDLETSTARWFAVLLLGVPTEGYLVPSDVVLENLSPGKWKLAGDGDYKINEPRDVRSADRFASFEEFLDKLDRQDGAV